MAQRLGVSAGAVAIAWTLQNPAVDGAIVGVRRPEQVDELLVAATLSLGEQDIEALWRSPSKPRATACPYDEARASAADRDQRLLAVTAAHRCPRELLDSQVVGVMATEPPQGHPLQSVVYYVRDEERLLISSVAGRSKVKDVERTGWASLCVMSFAHPYPSATFSGSTEVLTEHIGDPTAALAQRFMQLDELPEPQTDEALASVGRVIVAIAIERVAAIGHLG